MPEKNYIPGQISVAIPAYNEERFLREALDSVVNQVDCVILSDNASTDGTEAICREYAAKYPHVKYFRQAENVGSLRNLQFCLQQVETEFVFHIGAHDLVPPNYVAALKAGLGECPDYCGAYADCDHLELDGTTTHAICFSKGRERSSKRYFTEILEDDRGHARTLALTLPVNNAYLIFGIFRSVAIVPIWINTPLMGGCDGVVVWTAVLQAKLRFTHKTVFIRRMVHPRDNWTTYMKRIVGASSPSEIASYQQNNDHTFSAMIRAIKKLYLDLPCEAAFENEKARVFRRIEWYFFRLDFLLYLQKYALCIAAIPVKVWRFLSRPPMITSPSPQHCPVCHSDKTSFVLQSHDDRYGYPDSFPIDRCQECGHAFLRGNFSPEMLSDLYTNYYPRGERTLDSFQIPREPRGFLSWLDGDRAHCYAWVPKDVRVLDVGCGCGESLAYYKRRGCDAYGVETDRHTLKFAENFGLNIRVEPFSADSFECESFDYITMEQVLEHAVDPHETFRSVSKLLKPGGKLVFTCPTECSLGRWFFGRRWLHWHTPYHLQFFTRRSVQHLAAAHGFEIALCRSLTESQWLLYQWFILVVHGAAGRPSELWKKDKDLYVDPAVKRRWLVRLGHLLSTLRLHALLMRFADFLGIGDNRVYILVKK